MRLESFFVFVVFCLAVLSTSCLAWFDQKYFSGLDATYRYNSSNFSVSDSFSLASCEGMFSGTLTVQLQRSKDVIVVVYLNDLFVGEQQGQYYLYFDVPYGFLREGYNSLRLDFVDPDGEFFSETPLTLGSAAPYLGYDCSDYPPPQHWSFSSIFDSTDCAWNTDGTDWYDVPESPYNGQQVYNSYVGSTMVFYPSSEGVVKLALDREYGNARHEVNFYTNNVLREENDDVYPFSEAFFEMGPEYFERQDKNRIKFRITDASGQDFDENGIRISCGGSWVFFYDRVPSGAMGFGELGASGRFTNLTDPLKPVNVYAVFDKPFEGYDALVFLRFAREGNYKASAYVNGFLLGSFSGTDSGNLELFVPGNILFGVGNVLRLLFTDSNDPNRNGEDVYVSPDSSVRFRQSAETRPANAVSLGPSVEGTHDSDSEKMVLETEFSSFYVKNNGSLLLEMYRGTGTRVDVYVEGVLVDSVVFSGRKSARVNIPSALAKNIGLETNSLVLVVSNSVDDGGETFEDYPFSVYPSSYVLLQQASFSKPVGAFYLGDFGINGTLNDSARSIVFSKNFSNPSSSNVGKLYLRGFRDAVTFADLSVNDVFVDSVVLSSDNFSVIHVPLYNLVVGNNTMTLTFRDASSAPKLFSQRPFGVFPKSFFELSPLYTNVRILNVSLPEDLIVNETVPVLVVLENDGEVILSNLSVQITSHPLNRPTQNTFRVSENLSQLKNGFTHTLTLSAVFGREGDEFFGAQVLPKDEESDVLDNVFEKIVSVEKPPPSNLYIKQVSIAPPLPIENRETQLRVVVGNNGLYRVMRFSVNVSSASEGFSAVPSAHHLGGLDVGEERELLFVLTMEEGRTPIKVSATVPMQEEVSLDDNFFYTVVRVYPEKKRAEYGGWSFIMPVVTLGVFGLAFLMRLRSGV